MLRVFPGATTQALDIMGIEPELLSEIRNRLNCEATNYSVFLHSYQVEIASGASSSESIRSALGPEVDVGGIKEVADWEAIAEMLEGLAYSGDSGAGPDPKVLNSLDFVECLDNFVVQTQAVAKAAKKIESFWLNSGHPAYPVFWDFAFLFTGDCAAVVVIGSSSD